MNYELKPGMLCLIIGSDTCPENIGKAVTLETLIKKGEHIHINGETLCYAASAGKQAWLVKGEGLRVSKFSADLRRRMADLIGDATLCAPHHLLPIPPESLEQRTKHEEEQPA